MSERDKLETIKTWIQTFWLIHGDIPKIWADPMYDLTIAITHLLSDQPNRIEAVPDHLSPRGRPIHYKDK